MMEESYGSSIIHFGRKRNDVVVMLGVEDAVDLIYLFRILVTT